MRHRYPRSCRSHAFLTLLALPLLIDGCPQFDDALLPGTPWTRHTISDQFNGADGVKLGDVNADGLTDLVVGWEQSGVVTIHVNPGPLLAQRRWPTAVVGRVGDVEDAVFVDLDNDGALDVVSCSQGDTRTMHVHWAPQDSSQVLDDTRWETDPIPATRGARRWMFAVPAQIDRQRGLDLFAGAKRDNGQIGWLESPDDPRDLSAWRWHTLRSAGWTMSLIPVDLNADGWIDLVASDRRGSARGVFWLRNPGAGLPQRLPWPVERIDFGDDEVMFADLADLDADGLPDLIAATSARQVNLHEPGGLLRWTRMPVNFSGQFGTGKGVRAADLDLDGQPDIVFSCENAGGRFGVGWLSRTSLLGADVWTAQPISGTAGSKFDLVQVLDLDADGDLDVITTEESAGLGVVWYENPTVR